MIQTGRVLFLPESDVHVKPSQVFIRARTSSYSPPSSSSAEATKKDDDNDNNNNNGGTMNALDTRGLIDYVDYGTEGNSFLLGMGVASYPSAENLATLLLERQAKYLSASKENVSDVITKKLAVYVTCLKQLSAASMVTRQFDVEPLRSRLRNEPWCLGYQTIDRADRSQERTFRIVRPCDIYLDDDHQCALDLRPLCAPDEPELTKFYERFGARWLSECVQRTLIHRGERTVT
jgi:hypothetical protein